MSAPEAVTCHPSFLQLRNYATAGKPFPERSCTVARLTGYGESHQLGRRRATALGVSVSLIRQRRRRQWAAHLHERDGK